jgi:hypothetical protein
MVRNRLVQICTSIKGFIFTFDWTPAIRIIVDVCKELDIPTILIPRKSVFFDPDKYYYDIQWAQASIPAVYNICGLSEVQQKIFIGRGYLNEHFEIVGSPKLDRYKNYQPKITELNNATMEAIKNIDFIAVDETNCYLISPEAVKMDYMHLRDNND